MAVSFSSPVWQPGDTGRPICLDLGLVVIRPVIPIIPAFWKWARPGSKPDWQLGLSQKVKRLVEGVRFWLQ